MKVCFFIYISIESACGITHRSLFGCGDGPPFTSTSASTTRGSTNSVNCVHKRTVICNTS
jgi:hypothetical protein